MKATILAICCFLINAAHAAPYVNYGKPDYSAKDISLVALIANPDAYDGKPVRVIGAFQLEFEGNELCLHKEDLVQGLTKNCVWIEPDLKVLGVSYEDLTKFNGKYVLVEGTFVKGDLGHMSLNSGAITPIWRVALWR